MRVIVLAGILAAAGAIAIRALIWGNPPAAARTAVSLPRPDHTVVVIMENHSYSDIIGNTAAPYINSLRAAGRNFTDSHAVAHPSEPNYLALFAGTTENISDDSCPHSFNSGNLGSGLLASGHSFAGYSDSMPSDGYTGCVNGNYARKHNPWVNYTNVPASSNLTFAAFPANFSQLPTVAFVAPDLCNSMHDCSVATGDAWLLTRLDAYVQWAKTHNALLILTFDEDEGGNTPTNQIPTIFVGPMVLPGDDGTRIDHYTVLRTLEDMYGLPATGNAIGASAVTDVWQSVAPTPIPRAPIFRVPRPTPPVT